VGKESKIAIIVCALFVAFVVACAMPVKPQPVYRCLKYGTLEGPAPGQQTGVCLLRDK